MKISPFCLGWVGWLSAATLLAAERTIGPHRFTLPDGFEVELASRPDLVRRPVSGSLDEQGRLYLTDSSGDNRKGDVQAKDPTHRVVRLEDSDGDGRYDRSVVFAEKIALPEGCLWHEGSLYVGAPPSIWKFTDTDGDGVSDTRTEWFKGGTVTGCANDLHGPYAGPDGFIYWTKGAFAKQRHERPGRSTIEDSAAHIYRMRPDGSDLEQIMSGGMDNPVGVAFNPVGEAFFTSTFIDFTRPGRRDGMAHAILGATYGKVNDVMEDRVVRRTGPFLPVMAQYGPGAPCGLCRYDSDAWGSEFRDNLFATLFNLKSVIRHRLVPDGVTYRSEDSTLLSSDNPDFHPTDVVPDADGSLLVVDTGGWYKLCCPSSQLEKTEVLGAVYRIWKQGTSTPADPRGAELAWNGVSAAEYVNRLSDHRPAVRRRSQASLVRMGDAAVPSLTALASSTSNEKAGTEAVWTLAQIRSEAAMVALRSISLHSGTASRAALKARSIARDAWTTGDEARGFSSTDPELLRNAVELAGRSGNARTIPLLLTAARGNWDRYTQHVLTIALTELNRPSELADALKRGTDGAASMVGWLALENLDPERIPVDEIVNRTQVENSGQREMAEWLLGRHPEWGARLAGPFRGLLRRMSGFDPALGARVARFSGAREVQDMLGAMAGDVSTGSAGRRIAMEAMRKAEGLQGLPDSWVAPLQSAVAGKDSELSSAALAVIRVHAKRDSTREAFAGPLKSLAESDAAPRIARWTALASLPVGVPMSDGNFAKVREDLAPAVAPELRSAALDALLNSQLTEPQVTELLPLVREAGPLELPRLLSVTSRHARNEEASARLLETLRNAKSSRSLRTDQITNAFAEAPPAVRSRVIAWNASRHGDTAAWRKRLDEIEGSMPPGDLNRGQVVFNGAKAACATCHKIGYVGGTLGPDLTNLGEARTERDILESIVFPSASFVRSYEPVVVTMKNGDVFSGIPRGEGAEFGLATGPQTEERIVRSEVAGIRAGEMSLMPAGLEEQLTRQELSDLVKFVKSVRWGVQARR